MTTKNQIAANRANAKFSTGPKTPEGKAHSRENAWKHGLTAAKIIILGEKASDFEAFYAELWRQFEPAPGLESILVDRLAAQGWRLRRAAVYEAACLYDPLNVKLEVNVSELHKLALVARYETNLMNNFHRTLQQLLALQDRRRSQEEVASEVSAASKDRIEVIPESEDRNAA
jgi:hypothetical protein